MPSYTLVDPLDYRTITSLFLYGQPTPPQTYDERIRQPGAPTVDANVSSSFWSPGGPGRFAMPALNAFVQSFFTNTASIFTSAAVLQIFTNKLAAQGGTGTASITVA
jgi:hypothetical protein